jgi:hypothetical protein
MKTLKAICTAGILALALSVPAYAGDLETPGFTSPPPPANSTAETSTTDLSASEDIGSSGFEAIWLALISLF